MPTWLVVKEIQCKQKLTSQIYIPFEHATYCCTYMWSVLTSVFQSVNVTWKKKPCYMKATNVMTFLTLNTVLNFVSYLVLLQF